MGYYLGAISQEMIKISILDMSLKITHLRLQPYLTANALNELNLLHLGAI